MSSPDSTFRLSPARTAERVGYGLVLAALAGVGALLALGGGPEERVRLLRVWALASAAIFAVGVPHVLLPDAHVPMLQLLARPPRALLAYQLRRWGRVVLPCILPGLVLATGTGFGVNLMAHLAANFAVALGVAAYGFVQFTGIGPASQAWQEGGRGGWYRALKENSPGGFAVPDGMVPAMLATTWSFGVGLAALVASAYLSQSGALAVAWLPGGLVLAYSAWRLARRAPAYDYGFYATSAFYAEVFQRAGGLHDTGREPIPYGAVYWVPRRWRPSVWAGLRQLDRRLPLGRFVALGVGVLWLLFWQGVPGPVAGVYLLLLLTAKNAAVALLATEALAPGAFQQMLRPPAAWIGTRFFVNLRWTPPILGALALAAFFGDGVGAADVLAWAGADILLALLAALFVTYAAEFRYPRRFA